MNRIIHEPGKNDIVVITTSETSCCVYRRKKNDDDIMLRSTFFDHHSATAGSPSDSYDFFSLPINTSDEVIIMCVNMYEKGHKRGWEDGQYKLKEDFRSLMSLAQRS